MNHQKILRGMAPAGRRVVGFMAAALILSVQHAQMGWAASPSVPSQSPPTLIVRVGNTTISEADVAEREHALVGQGGTGQEDARARRELAIRQLIAEHVVEQSLDAASALPPDLAAQLAASRRQQMLAYVITRRLAQSGGDRVPDAAAINAFINGNPRIFAGRARFTLTQIVARTDGPEAEYAAMAALARLPTGQAPDAAQITAVKSALQSAHLLAGAVETTQNSEQLPGPLLDKLERMAATHSYINMERKPGGMDILVLQSRQADPVDPALVRNQIALGLTRQNADKAAKVILREISDPLYQRIDPSVARQPRNTESFGEDRSDGARALLRAMMPNLDYFVLRRIAAFAWWGLAIGPLAMVLRPQLRLRKATVAQRLSALTRQFGNVAALRAVPLLVLALSLAALPLGLRITSDASRDAIVLSLCGAISGGWFYPFLRGRFRRPGLAAALALASSLGALAAVL